MKAASILAATLLATAASNAYAQSDRQGSAINLPKACQVAAQASGQLHMMDRMKPMMEQGSRMMQDMPTTDTQKGLQRAMMAMQPAMMQGMLPKDADVAWICAMIPHHQGAIDMARAGLLGADNAESKRLAEETIKKQQEDIAKLIAWVDKHAEQESRNETTGATAK